MSLASSCMLRSDLTRFWASAIWLLKMLLDRTVNSRATSLPKETYPTSCKGILFCSHQTFPCWRETVLVLAWSPSCFENPHWLCLSSRWFAQRPSQWGRQFTTGFLLQRLLGQGCNISGRTVVWIRGRGTALYVLGRYRKWPNGPSSLVRPCWFGRTLWPSWKILRRCSAGIAEAGLL